MLLIQVTLPHFTAGVVSDRGKISRAAPILGWSKGGTPQELAAWVVKRGGAITVVRRWRNDESS